MPPSRWPGARAMNRASGAPPSDRLGVWAVRALIPIGQLTIAAGTVATASGPHAGAHAGQLVRRFDFEGTGTLEWVVQRHAVIATVFGLATIGVWLLLRRPGGDRRAIRPLTAVIGLLALQGLVGGLQWWLKLPSEIVWVHVALATVTWLAMLWTVATAGRLESRQVAVPRGATGERRSNASPDSELSQDSRPGSWLKPIQQRRAIERRVNRRVQADDHLVMAAQTDRSCPTRSDLPSLSKRADLGIRFLPLRRKPSSTPLVLEVVHALIGPAFSHRLHVDRG